MIDKTKTLYEITLQAQQAAVGADTEPDLDRSFDTTDEQDAPVELQESEPPWWKAISSAMHVPDPGWALDHRMKGPPENAKVVRWPERLDDPALEGSVPR